MPALKIEGRLPLRLRRDTLRVLIVAAVVAVLYVFYLAAQERRAEAFFENLRREDPVRYLDDLRRSEGFESYLAKYRLLEGFVVSQPEAPSFLVGRWTLQDKPQRVPTGTVFADCRNPVTFEQGLFEVVQAGQKVQYQARYRIGGSDVFVSGPKLGLMRVVLLSYGGAIDHLELRPPGTSKVLYGYFCGK